MLSSFNILGRFRSAYNAFRGYDDPDRLSYDINEGDISSFPRHKIVLNISNAQSIISGVISRCGIDAAALRYRHVRVDEEDRFVETISSGLNRCLSVEANIDQPATSFMQDVIQSMLDEGAVAVIPIDTTIDLLNNNSFDIITMRTAKIHEWSGSKVKLEAYNDQTGRHEILIMPKTKVAIIESPLFSVLNDDNSTLKRLIKKLNLLDVIDEQSGSGKLDIIVQLPYAIKGEKRQELANARRQALISQLKDSKYGIGYIDSTERVTQLNRPADNNIMSQVEYLTDMLFGQLGITQSVLDGTADEATLLNYYNRSVKPIAQAIIEEFTRKFITKTAQTQGQAVRFFKDPFASLTLSNMGEVVDKLTRNAIVSSNEVRSGLGLKPSTDPEADELRNKNIPDPKDTKEKGDIVDETKSQEQETA